MTDTKKPGIPDAVARILAQASQQRAAYGQNPETPEGPAGETVAAVAGDSDADPAVVEFCAELDHSDTDNGKRLRLHFGDDLLVLSLIHI